MRAPLSWPNHLPQAPPQNTITLGLRTLIYAFCRDINIQSKTQSNSTLVQIQKRHFPKDDTEMGDKYMKRFVQLPKSLGKCKWKLPCNSTIPLSECLKLKQQNVVILRTGKDAGQWELPFIVEGNTEWYSEPFG